MQWPQGEFRIHADTGERASTFRTDGRHSTRHVPSAPAPVETIARREKKVRIGSDLHSARTLRSLTEPTAVLDPRRLGLELKRPRGRLPPTTTAQPEIPSARTPSNRHFRRGNNKKEETAVHKQDITRKTARKAEKEALVTCHRRMDRESGIAAVGKMW